MVTIEQEMVAATELATIHVRAVQKAVAGTAIKIFYR